MKPGRREEIVDDLGSWKRTNGSAVRVRTDSDIGFRANANEVMIVGAGEGRFSASLLLQRLPWIQEK